MFSGGVSANSYLRKEISNNDNFKNINLIFPKIKYSTDNAVMIGALMYNILRK